MNARGPEPQRIAVVGAGLAGLTAAYRLARHGHRVTVFERHRAPGFVAHAVSVETAGSAAEAAVRVDVPIRVFYAGYYPTLVRLYAELGVASEAVSYASSFHGDDGRLFFRYRNWLAGGRSLAWVAPQDLFGEHGARARRIVAGALRFRRAASRALAEGAVARDVTIGDYVRAERYDGDFVRGLLLPAICTVCTCSTDDALRFPAAVIVDYLARGLTHEPVRRAVHGADDVARRLTSGVGALRLGHPLHSLWREEGSRGRGRASVALRLAGGEVERFDHVVLATQANQALALLDDAGTAERAVLGAFAYRPVEVVMHRDTRLLPARRRDWSAVNLLVKPHQAQPQSTIWVNRVQPALAPSAETAPLFQTVHPEVAPRDETVLSWARFERPMVTAATAQALQGLARLHAEPDRRVWFCGSYAEPGIPLLESAVRSAEVVAERLAERAACQACASLAATGCERDAESDAEGGTESEALSEVASTGDSVVVSRATGGARPRGAAAAAVPAAMPARPEQSA